MFKAVSKKFALSLSVLSIALGILLLPATSFTAEDYNLATTTTPTAYLEKSQIIGTGKQINVYGVPTLDNSGNIEYYDLTIKFGITSGGKFKTTPTVTAILSPEVYSNVFVPGTYFSDYSCGYGSATCTVTTGVLKEGRMEVAFACTSSLNSHMFSGSTASGPIPGHPSEPDLLAAGIDKISGYQNYSWGKVGSISSPYYPWWGCMQTGEIISARQVGSSIVLSGYDVGNVQKCGVTLVKK